MSLEGKLIVFTGTLAMKRAEAKALAEANGAKVGGSVTGKTDIMIAAKDAGDAKTEAAEKKGVEVWTEEQFMAACSGKPAKASGKTKAAAASEDEPPAKKKKAPAKKAAAKKAGSSELEGKLIVFTGTLAMKRAEAKALAEANGAKVGGSVTGKTDIMIAAKDAGDAKTEAAEKKGVEVWTEEQFMAAAGGVAVEEDVEMEEPAPKAKAKPAKKAKSEPKAEPKAANTTAVAGLSGGGGGGGRNPDRSVPNAGAYTVVDDYATKLSQTNLGNANNNKFYIIQVLESSGQYFTWNRWGRLGAEGQSALAPYGSEELAIKGFCKKFKDKTKNSWDERDNFVKYTGKYQLIETEGGDGDGGCADSVLGRLTESQINKGQRVLAEIFEILESGSKSDCTELSGEYYSFIPTTSGMKQPPVIDNMELWTEKQSLLELWLRMGFEELGPELKDNPLEGLEKLQIPTSLAACSAKISDKSSVDTATKRGQALAKTHAPKGKLAQEVWPAYYGAIVLYTGQSIYKKLNKSLREKHSQVPQYLPYLRLMLQAMSQIPSKKEQLYRGIGADLFEEYEVGKIITWWSVSSCTSDKGVAETFSKGLGPGSSFLTLECENAVEVSKFSLYASEKESLLAPGTQLEVISRTRVGRVAHIHVKEVGCIGFQG